MKNARCLSVVLLMLSMVSLAVANEVLIGAGGSLYVYDAAANTLGGAVGSGLGTIEKAAALSNGDALVGASSSGGALYRYDASTGSTGSALMTYGGTYEGVAAYPNGGALIGVSSSSGALYGYDASTHTVPGTLLGSYMGTINAMTGLAGGDVLVAGSQLWRYGTSSSGFVSGATCQAVAALSNGNALVGSSGNLYVYNASAQALGGATVTGLGTIGVITGLANGNAIVGTAAMNGSAFLIDSTGNYISQFMSYAGVVDHILALSNGDALVSAGGSLYSFDAGTGNVGSSLLSAGIGDMAALANGDALIGTAAGNVYLYNATTNTIGSPVLTGLGSIESMTVLVPEPATICLLSIGCVMTCFRRRIR